jgi:hypothetical protein
VSSPILRAKELNPPTQPVKDAYDDLLRRSLSKIPGDLARLVYLASTRDYNTGTYHHDGLAARFPAGAASKALEVAHRDVFYKLAACSLEELVDEVHIYVSSSGQSRDDVLHAWQKLEPYRVAVPVDLNPAVARLFISNVRLAVAILRRQEHVATVAHP